MRVAICASWLNKIGIDSSVPQRNGEGIFENLRILSTWGEKSFAVQKRMCKHTVSGRKLPRASPRWLGIALLAAVLTALVANTTARSAMSLLPAPKQLNQSLSSAEKARKKLAMQGPDARFWLSDYAAWHTRHRRIDCRRLIFRTPGAGIGDRFRGLVNVYLMAVVTQRMFLIDWRKPFPIQESFSTSHLSKFVYDPDTGVSESRKLITVTNLKNSLSLLYSDADIIISSSERPPKFISQLRNTSEEYYHYCSKLIPREGERGNYIDQCNSQREAMATLKVRELHLYRLILRNAFPVNSVLKQLHVGANHRFNICSHRDCKNRRKPTVWSLAQRRNPSKPYVAVHARLGTGLSEGSLKRFVGFAHHTEMIASCLAKTSLRRAAQKGLGESPHVYLATDTPDFRSVFVAAVRNLSANAVVLFDNDAPMHISRMRGSDVGSKKRPYLQSLVELLVLGHGEDLVSLKSGFPELAFMLGETPERYSFYKPEKCIERPADRRPGL